MWCTKSTVYRLGAGGAVPGRPRTDAPNRRPTPSSQRRLRARDPYAERSLVRMWCTKSSAYRLGAGGGTDAPNRHAGRDAAPASCTGSARRTLPRTDLPNRQPAGRNAAQRRLPARDPYAERSLVRMWCTKSPGGAGDAVPARGGRHGAGGSRARAGAPGAGAGAPGAGAGAPGGREGRGGAQAGRGRGGAQGPGRGRGAGWGAGLGSGGMGHGAGSWNRWMECGLCLP
jgi:hypothetical protein